MGEETAPLPGSCALFFRRHAVELHELSPADENLDQPIQRFGRDASVRTALALLVNRMHKHRSPSTDCGAVVALSSSEPADRCRLSGYASDLCSRYAPKRTNSLRLRSHKLLRNNERRAWDSNPEVLSDAGFQDRCNSRSANPPTYLAATTYAVLPN